MHHLLKSLYIQRVSADYMFAIFRDVTYKLYLHHYLNHKLSQLTRCCVTYIDERWMYKDLNRQCMVF
jgi:hypothetical protein